MSLKGILIGLILAGSISASQAQIENFHLSLGAGAVYYVGDLKDNTLPDPRFFNLFWQVQLGYKINQYFTITGGYMKGKLKGADALGRKNPGRDFFFQSKLKDYHLLLKTNLANWWDQYYFFTPRLLTGASYFRFDPMAGGVPLRLLGTEGQLLGGPYDKPYKPWSIATKVGLEVSFPITYWLDIDVFAIYNNTFTDHIDDVGGYYPAYEDIMGSPGGAGTATYTYRYVNGHIPPASRERGNPDMRDGYIHFGVNLTIWPWGKSSGMGGYRIDCPDYNKLRNPLEQEQERQKKKDQKKMKKGKKKKDSFGY